LVVSAASDLQLAFQEIGALYQTRTGTRVVFNFGSSGQLAQQIAQGAPVDLFAAANVAYVDDLEQKGFVVPGTKAVYGRGRLTLWTRADSPVQVATLTDLLSPQVRRVAIANPEHAPYGMAARHALQRAGVWEQVQPKLVLAENIRQALQYGETGDVEVAIVALSLSIGSSGRWVIVPQELYPPLDQALAVVRGTRHEAAARALAAFVVGAEGRAVLAKYGFVTAQNLP